MVRVWVILDLGVTALLCAIASMKKAYSAGYRLTTNNRMELMAAIVALEALKEHCEVVLSTDSQYVRQGITQWIITGRNAAGKRRTKSRLKCRSVETP